MSYYNCFWENNRIICGYDTPAIDYFMIIMKSFVFTAALFGYIVYMTFMVRIILTLRVPMKELTIITGVPGMGYTRYINETERLYSNRRQNPGLFKVILADEVSLRRALALGYDRIYVYIANHQRDLEIEKVGQMMGYTLNRVILYHPTIEESDIDFIRFVAQMGNLRKRKVERMIERLFYKNITINDYSWLGYKVVNCDWIEKNDVWMMKELENATEKELDLELQEYMEQNVKN